MHDKHQIIEEPCEAKVSRTVLKTSGTGDSLAEFNAPQYALKQLAQAWKQAFKKVKKPPRFKKKGKSDSFTVDGSLKVDHFRVKVPVVGWLKTYERLPMEYQPKSFTISRTADRWFISWKIEIEPSNEKRVCCSCGS